MARSRWIPGRRDMVWIDHNLQAGREIRGAHPLLIMSPREFNDRTGIVIGHPVTTASYDGNNPFAIPFVAPRMSSAI